MIPPSPSNDAGQCFTSGAAAKISQQAGLAQSQFFRVKTSAIRSRRPPSSRPSREAAGNGSPVFTGGATFPKIAAGFVRQLVASHTIETSTRSFNGRGETHILLRPLRTGIGTSRLRPTVGFRSIAAMSPVLDDAI